MDELLQVKMLSEDSELFEKEFKSLKDFYVLNTEKEIHEFIKARPETLILLDNYKKSLKQQFPDAVFELCFHMDVSGSWFDVIMLNIWVDEYTFNNGSAEKIRLLNKEFWPLRKKLDLLMELILSKRILDWQ